MRHRLLFQNENYTIEYNAIDNWLKIVWNEAQTKETIQQGYNKILQYIYAQNTPRLLDDQTNCKTLLNDAADWLANNWYPEAITNGLKFHAIVHARNKFNHLSTEKLKIMLKNNIIDGFEDISVAKKWLADLR